MESDLVGEVQDVLDVDAAAFQERVAEDAAVVKSELDAGTFDNPRGNVGLEYEFYAVADPDPDRSWTATDTEGGRAGLARVPRRLLEYVGFEKELGLHNAEMSTTPVPFNGYGLATQVDEVRARIAAAQEPMAAEGLRLVSDGMWTIPPAGETATGYLTDSVVKDGVRIATNMSESERYHAMANAAGTGGSTLEAPHVSLAADTVMPESLITSIQPHYQVPQAGDLPRYFRYALRVAGPLLSLACNSPFFPPDLYDDDATAEAVLEDGLKEHRIGVFESILNADDHAKVRFPRDVDTVEEAVDRIAADAVVVPMPEQNTGRFDDAFASFRTKHGTYWRWVRPVFGGASRSAANARIEFRPLPGQPTVADSVAFQAVYAGLLAALIRTKHPVAWLDWSTAEQNFYRAAADGLDADLTWITADDEETTDSAVIYEELLDLATDGLCAQGLSEAEATRYVGPLRDRVEAGVTPADWKRDAVASRIADGASLSDAIYGMKRRYLARQEETLLDGTFADWL